MTIRQFARLCGCNPQTLRYYDHEDLLKPVRVDQWSGYRFYEEEQALAFVKIKNLQKAGFTIGEIRELLDKDGLTIYRAFDEKIAEQERRLREIKAIQQSYQTEMKEIRDRIDAIREMIAQVMAQYDAWEEFGIGEEEYDGILSDILKCFENITPPGLEKTVPAEILRAVPPKETQRHDFLNDPNYEIVYEKHGWAHVKEFLDEFSDLRDGGEYALYFRDNKARDTERMAFENTLLSILLARNPGKKKTLTCTCETSKDGKNHFWMLKKR